MMFRTSRFTRFMKISVIGLGFTRIKPLISMSSLWRKRCLRDRYNPLSQLDLTLQEKDNKDWLNNVKMEIIQAIRQNIVPDTFLLDVQPP